MSPNPLSKIRSNVQDLYLGVEAVNRADPKVVALVMRVIGLWSSVELTLTSVLSALLESDFRVVVDMMAAITSAPARKGALMAAAARVLSEADNQRLLRVLKALDPIEDQRNKFAHWIWASSATIPDAFMLVDPKVLARKDAETSETIKPLRDWLRKYGNALNSADWSTAPAIPETPPTPTLDGGHVMVYKTKELEAIISEVQKAQRLAAALFLSLLHRDDESRSRLENLLGAEQSQPPPSTQRTEPPPT